MEQLYFNPGCALSLYKPQMEQQKNKEFIEGFLQK
jgi:hypothetical protein